MLEIRSTTLFGEVRRSFLKDRFNYAAMQATIRILRPSVRTFNGERYPPRAMHSCWDLINGRNEVTRYLIIAIQ